MVRMKQLEITDESIGQTIAGRYGSGSETFGLPITDYTDLIFTILNYVMTSYIGLGYRFIPMYDGSMTDEDYYNSIQKRMNVQIRKILFPAIQMVDNDLKYIFSDVEEESGHSSFTKTYEHHKTEVGSEEESKIATISETGTSQNTGITENAPLDSSLDITTPNFKSKNSGNSSRENSNITTVNDTSSGDVDINESESTENEHSTIRKSPSLTAQYLELIEKYNFMELGERCFRSVVYEFNCTL